MRCFLAISILLLVSAAFGADEEQLTLDAAVQQALERAPGVMASSAGVDSARALAQSAGRLPDPELIVGIDNLPVNGPDAYSTTRDFMTMRKVGVMQSFPLREKRRLQHERAAAEADLAAAELVATQLDVAREAAQAWIAVAGAHASLEALRALQPEIELGARTARTSTASGRASAADALAAEASAARLRNRIIQMQGDVRRARATLARWIGTEQANRPLAALPSLEDLPLPADTLVDTTAQHASLRPYEARLAAARAEADLARAERRPDWSVEASFAKRGPELSDMASIQFRVGLPLFAKNRQNPVIAARSADIRRIEAERDSMIQEHAAELRETVIEWQQLGEQIAQYEKELLPLARERSQVSLAGYRAGTADLKSLLGAVEDESTLLIDRASLQAARGRAWAALRYLEAQHLHR